MPTSHLYLCVDCGGTKTAAAIANSVGEVIAKGFGGPANYKDVARNVFLEAIRTAVDDAVSNIPITGDLAPTFSAAWVGASGIDTKQDIHDVTPAISDLLRIDAGPRLVVTNDTNLLASPLASYPDAETAITVISGTGSNVSAYRRTDTDGQLKELGRYGGWGWILGDEGSGFHVGREALRRLLAGSDRASVVGLEASPETTTGRMRTVVNDYFGIRDTYDLFGAVYAPDPTPLSLRTTGPAYLKLERKHRIASLSPLVFRLAFDEGDVGAMSVLQTTSSALADQIQAVMAAPSSDEDRWIDPKRTVLCFGGSLFSVKGYRQLILDYLRRQGIVFAGSRFVEDVTASGAASLARTFKARSL